MELKTKNQYTYLIYPYIVDEKKYDEYLLRLLESKNCNLKLWNKDNDLGIYTYFQSNIREKIFWPFLYSKSKINQLDALDNEFKSKILSKYEVTTFEYMADKNIQGKIEGNNNLLFDINKIEIVCFKTGICFILLKTSLGKEIEASDVIEFNNKFRSISYDFKTSDEENIKIQYDNLKDVKELSSIINNIRGTNKDIKELNISEDRILTYTYLCLKDESWKDKLYKVYTNELNNIDKLETIDLSEFLKVEFTKQSTTIISSDYMAENTIKMPYIFEQEYLYTYLVSLYEKIYINKLSNEYEETKKFEKVREKLEDFTENIWIEPITKNENGIKLNKKWGETLQTQYKYEKLKLDMSSNNK